MGESATGTADRSCRVAVVCPYALARAGLCHLLGAGRYRVVWQGGDGRRLAADLVSCRPDLILLGWDAPGVDVSLVERLADSSSGRTVVVLAPPKTCHKLSDVLAAGAAGCLSCNLELADFLASLEMLIHGDMVVSHELTSSVISSDGDGPESRLTPRELQVLQALGRGATNCEIAKELFLSPHTVKIHVHQVLTRMGFRNRQQAAAYIASRENGRPPELDA